MRGVLTVMTLVILFQCCIKWNQDSVGEHFVYTVVDEKLKRILVEDYRANGIRTPLDLFVESWRKTK